MSPPSASSESDALREGFASTAANPQGQEGSRVSPVPFVDPTPTASDKMLRARGGNR